MLTAITSPFSSVRQVCVALSGAVLGWLICFFVYRLLFHPLAKYPGPLIGKLTGLFMMSESVAARSTYTRHKLHQKYGPIVRTGPNELSFSDKAAIKDIYGQSSQPCLKHASFYAGFTLTGLHSVFSCVDRTEHARLRRLLAHAYSERGVMKLEGEISQKIQRFIIVLRHANNPVNLYGHIHHLLLDLTSQLSFSTSFDFLHGVDSPLARDISTYFSIAALFGIAPLAKHIPFGPFKAAAIAKPRLLKSLNSLVQDLRQRLKDGSSAQSFLRYMMEAVDKDTGTVLSDEELIENAALFIEAGSGTTASSLVYLIYELGRRPEMQKRVVEEIRQIFPDLAIFPTYEVANKLTYLSQTIREVLRLRGPLSTFSPRVSPGKPIGGEYIPVGVTVCSLPYTTGRDPNVFPDPLQFKPDRWAKPTEEMQIMDRPFSSGSRVCIGMHLSRVEMLLTACAFYQAFDVSLDSNLRDEDMELFDQGLMTPIGKSLLVNLTPVA